MDDDGLVPEALRQAIAVAQARRQDDQVPLHDPQLPQPRRRDAGRSRAAPRSSTICQRRGRARPRGQPLRPARLRRPSRCRRLRADEPEGVVYLGSFSKTFAPGLRVGWVLAPHAVREKLVLAQESATLCPPAFNQMVVSAYLAQHDWQGQVKQSPGDVPRAPRRDARGAGTTSCPPRHGWTVPHRRLLRLADAARRARRQGDAAARASPARVAYVPGTGFYADGFGSGSTAAVVLLPDAGADPRGRPPARRRPRGGARAAGDVRRRRHAHPPRPRSGRTTALARHGPRMRPRPASSWSSPAGSRTSATCRCAPGAVRPRRCAPPGSRSTCATSTPPCWPGCSPSRLPASCSMLHGESGEDGALREVLELLGLPYVGSAPGACRTAFDKPIAKAVVARRPASPTPASVCLPHETFRELGAAAVLDGMVAAPRPAARWSSRPGAARRSAARSSTTPPSCPAPWSALRLRRRRRWSSGSSPAPRSRSRSSTRLRAPGAAGGRDRPTAASTTTPPATPPGRPSSSSRPAARRRSPAECARVAVAAHEALGLRDLSRSDLIVGDDGTVWFLEVNVAPGMTETSLLPLSVEAAGLDLGDVLASLVRPRGPRRRGRPMTRADATPRSSGWPSSASGCWASASRSPATSTSRAPAVPCSPSTTSATSTSSMAGCPSTSRPTSAVHGQARALRPQGHRADHARLPPHRGRPGRRRALAARWRRDFLRPRRGGRHLPGGHHLPGDGDQGAQDRRGADRRRGRRPVGPGRAVGHPAADDQGPRQGPLPRQGHLRSTSVRRSR